MNIQDSIKKVLEAKHVADADKHSVELAKAIGEGSDSKKAWKVSYDYIKDNHIADDDKVAKPLGGAIVKGLEEDGFVKKPEAKGTHDDKGKKTETKGDEKKVEAKGEKHDAPPDRSRTDDRRSPPDRNRRDDRTSREERRHDHDEDRGHRTADRPHTSIPHQDGDRYNGAIAGAGTSTDVFSKGGMADAYSHGGGAYVTNQIGGPGQRVSIAPANDFVVMRSFSAARGGRRERVFVRGRGNLDQVLDFHGQTVSPAEDAADRAEELHMVKPLAPATTTPVHTAPHHEEEDKKSKSAWIVPAIIAALAALAVYAFMRETPKSEIQKLVETKREMDQAAGLFQPPVSKNDEKKDEKADDAAPATPPAKPCATPCHDGLDCNGTPCAPKPSYCKPVEKSTFDENGNTVVIMVCPDGNSYPFTVNKGRDGVDGMPGTGCEYTGSAPNADGVMSHTIKCGNKTFEVKDGARGARGFGGRSAPSVPTEGPVVGDSSASRGWPFFARTSGGDKKGFSSEEAARAFGCGENGGGWWYSAAANRRGDANNGWMQCPAR